MLYDDAALEQALEAFLETKPSKGTIFTNCATVYPGCSEALAKKAGAAGVIYLSAPIFGRPDAIAAHKGLCVSSGPEEGRQRVCTCCLNPAALPPAALPVLFLNQYMRSSSSRSKQHAPHSLICQETSTGSIPYAAGSASTLASVPVCMKDAGHRQACRALVVAHGSPFRNLTGS